MKQRWQWEQEDLERLGFVGTEGDPSRERAVDIVISMLKEIERLRTMVAEHPNAKVSGRPHHETEKE